MSGCNDRYMKHDISLFKWEKEKGNSKSLVSQKKKKLTNCSYVNLLTFSHNMISVLVLGAWIVKRGDLKNKICVVEKGSRKVIFHFCVPHIVNWRFIRLVKSVYNSFAIETCRCSWTLQAKK